MGEVYPPFQASWGHESAGVERQPRPMDRGLYLGPYYSYYTTIPTRPSLSGLFYGQSLCTDRLGMLGVVSFPI